MFAAKSELAPHHRNRARKHMSEEKRKPFNTWKTALLSCLAVFSLFALMQWGTHWYVQRAGATTATNTYSTAEQNHFLPAPEAPPSQASNAQTPAELVAEIKEAISDKQQSALTGLSNIVSLYATIITGLSAIFLGILGATIWKTGRDREALDKDLSKIDGKLRSADERLASVDMLARYASIMTIYGVSKRTASLSSDGNSDNIQATRQNCDKQLLLEKLMMHHSTFNSDDTNNPDEYWQSYGRILSKTIDEVLNDKTDSALKAGEQLYKLFERLPKIENCMKEQAKANSYFVNFFAQSSNFDEALLRLGALKTTFKDQTEPIAMALAYLVREYAINGQLNKGQKAYEEIKKLGNKTSIIEALGNCAPTLIFCYTETSTPANNAGTVNQLFQEMHEAYRTAPHCQFMVRNFARTLLGMIEFYRVTSKPEGALTIYDFLKELKGPNDIQKIQLLAYANILMLCADEYLESHITKTRTIFDAMKDLVDMEEIRNMRALASQSMITIYGKASNTKEARAIFDAMKDLGDTEEIRNSRATASVNMIHIYSLNDPQENIPNARALLDAMKNLGDTQAIRDLCARATVIMISIYGEAGNLEDAQKMYDGLLLFSDFPERQKLIVGAGETLIEAYANAKKPKKGYKTDALCSAKRTFSLNVKYF